MRLLLINPAYQTEKLSTTMADVHLAMEKKPPLGLLSLAAYIRQHTDFEIRILDIQLSRLSQDEICQVLTEFHPDIVGLTVVSFKLWEAHNLSALVRRTIPEAHIVWGGPHLAIYPRESLAFQSVDSIVLGDGEIPLLHLCVCLKKGIPPTSTRGLYPKEALALPEAEFQKSENRDLDSLPLLDLTLLPYRDYTAYLTGRRMSTLLTSRGCPFRCIFCQIDKRRIRLAGIDRVIQQIQEFVSLGIKEVEFYDETFNLTPERVKEFSAKLIREKINIQWSFRGRIDQVDREMLDLAKQSGCSRIQYGVESGSDRVLKVLKKNTTKEKIRRCFYLTNRAGIDTVAYMILGNPTETLADINETVSFIQEIKPSYVEYALFNISPGTEAYQMAMVRGLLKKDIWREYAAHPTQAMPNLIWDEHFSRKELEALRQMALRRFYLNPGYIARRLWQMKPMEARRTFITGCSMIKQLLFPSGGHI